MRRAQAVYSALHIHTKGTRCDWGQWEVNLDWVLSLHSFLIPRPGRSGFGSSPIEAQTLDLSSNSP